MRAGWSPTRVRMMVSGRSLEAATALTTGAFGAAVVVSSLDNGIGWSAAGVESGTFPFIVGLVIAAGSLFNLVQGWLHPRAERTQATGKIVRPGRGLCWSYSADRDLSGLGLLCVRNAGLAQAGIASAPGPRRDRRGVGALSDIRADVPDLVAARRARHHHRLLREGFVGKSRSSHAWFWHRAIRQSYLPDVDRRAARHSRRRAARPRGTQWRIAAAAANLRDAAGIGHHPALIDVLGRIVRRLGHLHPLQHSRRALIRRDHL